MTKVWGSFIEKPKLRFSWLREEEESYFLVRRFWTVFLIPVFVVSVFFFLPSLFWLLVLAPYQYSFTFSAEKIELFLLIWTLIGLLLEIYFFFNWFFDICLVTSERIVDIDQQGFFHQSVSETSLGNVQDVRYERRGLFQTIFNFGDVIIHTAGSTEGIVFENVGEPQRIQQTLLQLINAFNSDDEVVTAHEFFEFLKDNIGHLDLKKEEENSLENNGLFKDK